MMEFSKQSLNRCEARQLTSCQKHDELMLGILVDAEMSSNKKKRTSAPNKSAPDPAEVLEWVERVSVFWTQQSGLPPITGRIVGWLMVCDPPEQTAGAIADAIGASRASLTSSMRLLIAIGLVRSVRKSKAKTVCYQIEDTAWEATLRKRIAGLASFRQITRDGLDLVGPDSHRAARIKAADQVYAWAEAIFEKTLQSLPHGAGNSESKNEKSRRAK